MGHFPWLEIWMTGSEISCIMNLMRSELKLSYVFKNYLSNEDKLVIDVIGNFPEITFPELNLQQKDRNFSIIAIVLFSSSL